VEIRSNHFHGEAVAVEGAVMQHHIFRPAQAIENGSRAPARPAGESGTESVAEGADVRVYSVILLATAGSIAKSGDDFVENQQDAMLASQFAQLLEIARARGDTAHV